MPFSNRRPIVLLAVALAVSVAGAVAITAVGIDVPGADSDPDPDELVAEVVDAHGDVDTLQATRTESYEIETLESDEPRTGETTADVWKRPPAQSRTEVVDSTAPERDPGDVRVVDGTLLQNYDASQESMLVDDEWTGNAVSHWPVTTDALEEAALETSYHGTDTVDGRETDVVEIEPAENESATGISLLVGDTEYALEVGESGDEQSITRTTTWWIDREVGFPIKERVVTEHDEPEAHVLERERDVRTVTYEDVQFDEAIDDERFALEPPTGTDVYESAEAFDVDTVADADDAVHFDVQEPTVPDDFDRLLVTAREFRGETTVDVRYRVGDVRDGEDISVRIADAPFERGDVLADEVGPHDGTLVSTAEGPGYVWECDDAYYEVIAGDDPDVDDQFALELAGTIDCSAS